VTEIVGGIVMVPITEEQAAQAAARVEQMLGEWASAEMIERFASWHDLCAAWEGDRGHDGRAAVFIAAAAALRDRARRLE
jgi:hypothetical protein